MDKALSLEVEALASFNNLRKLEESGESEIQKFFSGKTVFITGGTGFLGKQLTEKLLRSCDVKKIYLLIRPKKGKDIKQRLQDLLANVCYDMLRKKDPNFSEKIIAIEGDAIDVGLGLSETNKNILFNEVDVIFHVGATVRFDESIKKAILTNVRGTREMLFLASECKKLRAFVYVSTAYSHVTRRECKEEFYPAPIPPELLIEMAETVDEETLLKLTPGLIGDWPNTYTFSKALAEDEIKRLAVQLNISAVVVRPAIVAASYLEPSVGWIDTTNVYGPSGIVLAIGLGVLHSMLADSKCNLDLVPVDMVNNLVIAAAYDTAKKEIATPPIYVYTSTNRNPLSWREVPNVWKNGRKRSASPMAVWYIFATVTSCKYFHAIMTFLWHSIPARLLDFGALLMGKEQKFTKQISKLNKLIDVLSYFTLNEWLQHEENTQRLYSSLNGVDKELFNFDITTFKWVDYMKIWHFGVRKYIIKDELKNTDLAITKQFWFRIGHYIVVSLYAFIFWNILSLMYYVFKIVVFGLCSVL